MSKGKTAMTPALRMLKEHGAAFEEALYKYEDKGGTKVAARELGVEEHTVIKTLVMEDEGKNPFIVLMHGDREVSTKELARVLGVKTVAPCSPDAVNRHTGYMPGGVSPFGTRKRLPVYVEDSILALREICINGGKRGLLVKMPPGEMEKILGAIPVSVSRE
ncbi:MAG: Cys-tRNA(Pro) deacylase [Syntrophobacteraceae bacterium]|jgi:Cys-tRNA(Pro) deacylase